MTLRELLKIEIPKPLVARMLVFILLTVAYLLTYWVVATTLSPKASGETPGEAAISRGGFFFMFSPVAAIAAFVSGTFAVWQKSNLSRFWIWAGVSPLVALVPAAAIVLLRFGNI